MIIIKTKDFNAGTPNVLKEDKYGSNWPVVYILNNKKEAYIGETTNVSNRAFQHYSNSERKKLNKMHIISDDDFNKSVALDLESFLITHMSADEMFKLQNGNHGLQDHNYYHKQEYRDNFEAIWNNLRRFGLVRNDLLTIRNSDLFKYSPYKSLTADQYLTADKIIKEIASLVSLNEPGVFLVNGGAGTGKTILGVYLLKLLKHSKEYKNMLTSDEEVEDNIADLIKIANAFDDLKICLVIPQNSLRRTLKKVLKGVKGLNSKMVISPHDLAKEKIDYDIVIVDEAHRLRRRKNFAQYKTFDQDNKKLGFDNNGTELDWILKKSKYQILFYDSDQSIKPTDVNKERFKELENKQNYHQFYLETQLRCLVGGNEYINYIKSIFSDNPPNDKIAFKKYDLIIFDDVDDMIQSIKEKDKEYGLCRNVAGFAWKWNRKRLQDSTIEIGKYKYKWNTKSEDWINSKNAIDEIGCIHTTQGYDLNYTGLIIGRELDYDLKNNKFIVNRDLYFDINGKKSSNDKELLDYILNIYRTMMFRGMLGTFVYVCNDGLREYLKKYIDCM